MANQMVACLARWTGAFNGNIYKTLVAFGATFVSLSQSYHPYLLYRRPTQSAMAPQNGFARPADYGLPHVTATQALTPIDMHMPRIYGMRWILAFSLDETTSKATVYNQLKEALAHTAQEIPWIAGNVASSTQSGSIEVVDGALGVPFRFNDLSNPEARFPTYATLKAAHFPLAELSTAQLAPIGVMPETAQSPAFTAQANFIVGGLLLTVCAHHAVCDAAGLNTIVQTWAQMSSVLSTGGSPIAIDPIINDRTRLMTGTPGATVDEFPQYILAPTPPAATTSLNSHEMGSFHYQLPPMTARVFKITAASLTSLKAAAAAYSSNDALTALVWRHVTLARSASSANSSATASSADTTDIDSASASDRPTLLLLAANIRAKLSPPLPLNYTGNASLAGVTRRMRPSEFAFTTSRRTADAENADANAGLKLAASAIRHSVKNLITSPETVGRVVGLIQSRDDPTDFKFAYDGFLGPDLSSTSWVDLDVYGLLWGGVAGLGRPEAFRVPGEGGDGSMAVFPRLLVGVGDGGDGDGEVGGNGMDGSDAGGDGDVEFMVSLEAGAMGRLLGDKVFGAWVEAWA